MIENIDNAQELTRCAGQFFTAAKIFLSGEQVQEPGLLPVPVTEWTELVMRDGGGRDPFELTPPVGTNLLDRATNNLAPHVGMDAKTCKPLVIWIAVVSNCVDQGQPTSGLDVALAELLVRIQYVAPDAYIDLLAIRGGWRLHRAFWNGM